MKIGDIVLVRARVEELREEGAFVRLSQGQGVELRAQDVQSNLSEPKEEAEAADKPKGKKGA